MKKVIFLIVVLLIIIIGVFIFSSKKGSENGEIADLISQEGIEITTTSTNMKIESSAFIHDQLIPSNYTCDGANIIPPLSFSDVPENTQSLALIMEDPDVPVSIRPDGMWDHWAVFNIPPETREVKEGQEPEKGVQGMTTFGKVGYGGPCPPDREHRYFFKLYALDIMLDLAEGATKKELIDAMQGHILSSAELVGRYERI